MNLLTILFLELWYLIGQIVVMSLFLYADVHDSKFEFLILPIYGPLNFIILIYCIIEEVRKNGS